MQCSELQLLPVQCNYADSTCWISMTTFCSGAIWVLPKLHLLSNGADCSCRKFDDVFLFWIPHIWYSSVMKNNFSMSIPEWRTDFFIFYQYTKYIPSMHINVLHFETNTVCNLRLSGLDWMVTLLVTWGMVNLQFRSVSQPVRYDEQCKRC